MTRRRISELRPPVILHRVPGFRAEGTDTNELEADWIAALVAACCAHPAYKEATLGVISLLGEDQARAVLDRVRQRIAPEELEQRAFIAGDAYHFQGDERDVMFLSLVEAPGERRPAVLNGPTRPAALNVAASRARDQMWLFHSIDAEDFHPDDMRGRLLAHFAQPDPRARDGATWRRSSAMIAHYSSVSSSATGSSPGYRERAEFRVGSFGSTSSWTATAPAWPSSATESDGTRWTPTGTT